jgi:hypothetical protein
MQCGRGAGRAPIAGKQLRSRTFFRGTRRAAMVGWTRSADARSVDGVAGRCGGSVDMDYGRTMVQVGLRSVSMHRMTPMALALALSAACLASGAWAADTPRPPAKDPMTAKSAHENPTPTRYLPDRFAGRAGKYYELIWGIDSISVKLVESGELVRFSYRILDPGKARALNDKQNEASLNDPKAGVSLVVPTMEKVGQLRQTSTPEAGHSYWMTFSNKGRRVGRGDRVDVVIGQFKASNLVVD